MPGPAPSANPRRRNARPDQTVLPSTGRPGAAPDWPLRGKPPTCWYELWRTPQAVAWETLGLARLVARYAVQLTEAEKRNATTAVLAEVRQLEDRLGLSPMAMLRLRWTVAAPAPAQSEDGVVVDFAAYRDDDD